MSGDAEAARHCLDLLAEQVRVLMDKRSAHDPQAGDPFRGLRLSADHVEWLLQARDLAHGTATVSAEQWPRLAELAETSGSASSRWRCSCWRWPRMWTGSSSPATAT